MRPSAVFHRSVEDTREMVLSAYASVDLHNERTLSQCRNAFVVALSVRCQALGNNHHTGRLPPRDDATANGSDTLPRVAFTAVSSWRSNQPARRAKVGETTF